MQQVISEVTRLVTRPRPQTLHENVPLQWINWPNKRLNVLPLHSYDTKLRMLREQFSQQQELRLREGTKLTQTPSGDKFRKITHVCVLYLPSHPSFGYSIQSICFTRIESILWGICILYTVYCIQGL